MAFMKQLKLGFKRLSELTEENRGQLENVKTGFENYSAKAMLDDICNQGNAFINKYEKVYCESRIDSIDPALLSQMKKELSELYEFTDEFLTESRGSQSALLESEDIPQKMQDLIYDDIAQRMFNELRKLENYNYDASKISENSAKQIIASEELNKINQINQPEIGKPVAQPKSSKSNEKSEMNYDENVTNIFIKKPKKKKRIVVQINEFNQSGSKKEKADNNEVTKAVKVKEKADNNEVTKAVRVKEREESRCCIIM